MLNELAKAIHQNSVEHGWWEEERSFGSIIALIHSELSEALEEYRSGYKPKEIYTNDLSEKGRIYKPEFVDLNLKPEGIPIELADVIIRVLDYCGKVKIDPDIFFNYQKGIDRLLRRKLLIKGSCKTAHFGDIIAYFHKLLSDALERKNYAMLVSVINAIWGYCVAINIDINEAIKIKMAYNRTRPYKHGGKKI